MNYVLQFVVLFYNLTYFVVNKCFNLIGIVELNILKVIGKITVIIN
jgi:hypothetical protein